MLQFHPGQNAPSLTGRPVIIAAAALFDPADDMADVDALLSQPLLLLPNTVYRPPKAGKSLDIILGGERTILSKQKPVQIVIPKKGALSDVKPLVLNSIRKKEHRRKKSTVHDLSPVNTMTTVQELPMDSPTIPGRPALHERSSSMPLPTPAYSCAYGDVLNSYMGEEDSVSTLSSPRLPKAATVPPLPTTEKKESEGKADGLPSVFQNIIKMRNRSNTDASEPLREPLRLEIPKSTSPAPIRVEDDDKPPEVPPKSPRTLKLSTPQRRKGRIYGKKSSKSKSSEQAETTASPETSPSKTSPGKLSPSKPELAQSNSVKRKVIAGLAQDSPTVTAQMFSTWWESNNKMEKTPERKPSPLQPAAAIKSERSVSPIQKTLPASVKPVLKKSVSENIVSTKEAKPTEVLKPQKVETPFKATSLDKSPKKSPKDAHSRSDSKDSVPRTPTEVLPLGIRPEDAYTKLTTVDIDLIQRQALEQANVFDVLSPNDVQALSKELQGLNERCDYLRKTYLSLRQGRRSLHGRMIQYLKSPQIANFSKASILQQEEALAELDDSIDDWTAKLDKAESRRLRVRQKLLEHVAATLTIRNYGPPVLKADTDTPQDTPPATPEKLSLADRPRPRPRPEIKSMISVQSEQSLQSIHIFADPSVYNLFRGGTDLAIPAIPMEYRKAGVF